MDCIKYNDIVNIISKTDDFHSLIIDWRDSGYLQKILPEISILDEYIHNPKYHTEGCIDDNYGTVLDHIIACIHVADCIIASPLTKMCVLFHDIGKGITADNYNSETHPYHTFYGHETKGLSIIDKVAKRIDIPNDDLAIIKYCIRHHMDCHRLTIMRPFKVKNICSSSYWYIIKDVAFCDSMSRGANLFSSYEFLKNMEYGDSIHLGIIE